MSVNLTSTDYYFENLVGVTRAYVTPLIVILGLFGNFCTLFVFVLEGKTHQWTRFSVYCIALAISDSGILILNGIMDDFAGRGLQYATGSTKKVFKLDTISNFMCKFMEYVPHAFYWSSSYILLAFTIDRLLTIFLPFRFRSHLLVKKAVFLVIIIAALGLVINIPMLKVHRLMEGPDSFNNSEITCVVDDTTGGWLPCIMVHLKSYGSFVLPSALVCVLSIVIVVKLTAIKNHQTNLLPNNQESQMELSRFYAHLGISIIFCIVTLPLSMVITMRVICRSGNRVHHRHLNNDNLDHLSRLFDSTKDINYAINFWIYCVCVPSFRKRLLMAIAHILVLMDCQKCCIKTVGQWAIQSVEKTNKKRRPTPWCQPERLQPINCTRGSPNHHHNTSRDAFLHNYT